MVLQFFGAYLLDFFLAILSLLVKHYITSRYDGFTVSILADTVYTPVVTR